MVEPAARARAAESVATRFTRIMNAATSRWGVVTDPPVLALATGIFLILLLASLRISAIESLIPVFAALTALPFLLGIGASLALLGARARVIEWLADLPFPVENLNAVLNGLGDEMEITFAASCPQAAEVNALLDAVSPDAFVTRAPGVQSDAATPADDRPIIEVRIGVVDSARNPSASNFQRFARVRTLIDTVLVPLHGKHSIVEVRIK
ncbi:MAG: hypothetical protein ABJE95_20925 [Byssovorax sp.]